MRILAGHGLQWNLCPSDANRHHRGPTSNYNRSNDVCGRVCGNRSLKRLMSPSPKSPVMFASAFS